MVLNWFIFYSHDFELNKCMGVGIGMENIGFPKFYGSMVSKWI